MHTMATPDLDPAGALAFAAGTGVDGIELVCQDGYRCAITPDTPLPEVRRLRQLAADLGLRIGGLVPYAKDQNSRDTHRREQAVAELMRCVERAAALRAPLMRVFAGHDAAAAEWHEHLARLADALRPVADAAADHGVTLVIENHMDTMATTAAGTMAIWRAIAHPAVGILYDPANLAFMGAEPHDEALFRQIEAIRHVHVKGFYWQGGVRRACLPGEGEVPWARLIGALHTAGYAAAWSLEYETRWFPDELPPAREGVAMAARFVAACLARSRGATG